MLAYMQAPNDELTMIHQTYLTANGEKADVEKVRKFMPGTIAKGSAVRLGEAGVWRMSGVLGIAEGIETALAARLLNTMVVWAALSEGLLKQFEPPKEVKRLVIYGDNDANYVGQAAAYELARRLSLEKRCEVEVMIPSEEGCDWCDVYKRISVENGRVR
jgi:putative DNA primase/helicase